MLILTQSISPKEIIIIVLAILLIVLAYFLIRHFRRKSLINKLHQLEVDVNSVRSTPLSYKLNKAVGLSKVNEEVVDQVTKAQGQFSDVTTQFENITSLLGDAEDEILTGNLNEGKTTMLEIQNLFNSAKTEVEGLNSQLDILLEDESRLRDAINTMKDEYHGVKQDYQAKHNQIVMASEPIEALMEETEQHFNSFEEWMYASEFEKAQEQYKSIQNHIFTLKRNLSLLPNLVEQANGIVPHFINETQSHYQEVLNKGVFLQHLEVPKTLEVVNETLEAQKLKIAQLDLDGVEEDLTQSVKHLQQLLNHLHKEEKAFDSVSGLRISAFNAKNQLNDELNELERILPEMKERFGFVELSDRLPAIKASNDSLNQLSADLQDKLTREQLPNTTLLGELKEFDADIARVNAEIQEANRLLNAARQDEQRATNQLLKLNLLMNEIETKIESRHLPHISNQYEGDVAKAHGMIYQINQLLTQNPLNIRLLNGTLHESIDFIYKLYNNVNNLVGTVDMVENAIVYANKYRSTSSELDSELTRAELSFRNGEYTHALKTAIYAIERFKPGTQYEELILQNAKSA